MAKLLTFALLLLAASTLVKTQGEATISTDFLTQLNFSINNSKIPDYLLHLIYEGRTDTNVTTQDILTLFSASEVSLVTTESILEQLNISHSSVFSLDGFNYTLELFNWTFKNFYNTFLTEHNFDGVAQKDALEALQINAVDFTIGMQFGTPDPWSEFVKGNFTRQNLETACASLAIDLEILWSTTKKLLTPSIIGYQIGDFLKLLENHNIGEAQALVIWNGIPVTVEYVYTVPAFANLLNGVLARVNSQVALGAVTGEHQVLIHRNIYDIFNQDRTLLDIRAITVLTGASLDILTANDTSYQNLVILGHNTSASLTVAQIESDSHGDLSNCSYITRVNNGVVSYRVATAIYRDHTYTVEDLVNGSVISGSALICNNSLYGLARGFVDGSILIDGFAEYVPENGALANFYMGKLGMAVNVICALLLLAISQP